jgi:hypothetical protein
MYLTKPILAPGILTYPLEQLLSAPDHLRLE